MNSGKTVTTPRDPMAGKKGFAPVVHKADGRELFLVARVTYGVRGYTPIMKRRHRTFAQAELAAERLNRRHGLSAEEAWLLVENTVMCGR